MDVTPIAVKGADTFIQYGAIGVVALLALGSFGFLLWRTFKKADQNEADCKARDLARQAEIAELRAKMDEETKHNAQQLQDAIENLAHIARAMGRAAATHQEETDRILFRTPHPR